MTIIRLVLLGIQAVVLCIATLSGVAAAEKDRPNIIIIMTDNLGYGDLGVYGGMRAPTPRIDKFAAEGVRFRDFQVEPKCTPTRAALMTGRLPIRSGIHSVDVPGEPGGLHPKEITLAELLKDAGYRTALFGKWHIGEAPERQPQNQGFDEFMGMLNVMLPPDPSSPGYDGKFAEINPIISVEKGGKPEKLADMDINYRGRFDSDITDKSVAYIRKHSKSGQPFFLWVSFTNPHHPVIPHPHFAGKSGGGAYADVLMEIDFNTGRVLDAINKSGIKDDTIVVWMSDNGPTMYSEPDQNGDPGPWTGQLGSTWEGGLRTAGMMRWPKRIKANWISDEIFHVLDLNVTLATLAGAKVPQDRPVDGIDQSDYLLGKQANSNRDHSIIFDNGQLAAVRWRQFKIHFIKHDKEQGIMEVNTPHQVPNVFNLRTDPKERHNMTGNKGGGFTFLFPVMNKVVGPYMKSFQQYPHADYSKFEN
ncbi:MAG: arylsulfatase [Gammaproteobacteria bacterium]|nr:arylsulfatase [Gammaproteobacteria bacterium]